MAFKKEQGVKYEGPNMDFRSKFHQNEGQAKKGSAEKISVNHPKIGIDSEAGKDNKHRLPHSEDKYTELSGFDSPRPKGLDENMSKTKKNQSSHREFEQKF